MCDSTVYNPYTSLLPFAISFAFSLSLSLSLSLPLPLSFSLSLSLSSRLYSEYTTYTLPKLRTLSTLSSIFISVKYWLDFGVERWGKGKVGGSGSTNGGRVMDERKKKEKKLFFRRSFDFSGDLSLSSFPSLFSSLLSTISLLHHHVEPPSVFVRISLRSRE